MTIPSRIHRFPVLRGGCITEWKDSNTDYSRIPWTKGRRFMSSSVIPAFGGNQYFLTQTMKATSIEEKKRNQSMKKGYEVLQVNHE